MHDTSHREFLDRKTFGSLDGLRALAILSVVWHHAARHQDLPWAYQGSMGVELFFAVSGFLITTLLLRERDRTGDISLPDFYARRSLRIFPLYYTVLLLYVVVVSTVPIDDADRATFFSNLPYFATYTSNWFVTLDQGRVIFYIAWSLATEEQFYLAWPSIERQLGRIRSWYPIAVALGLVGVWGLVQYGVVPIEEGLIRTILIKIAPPICLGVVLAHGLHERRTFSALWPVLGHPLAAPALLVASITTISLDLSFASYVLMTLLVGACVLREDHPLAPALAWRPLAGIGRVSYGIYLFHMLVLQAVEGGLRSLGVTIEGLPQPVLVFAFAVPAVWGVSVLSFRHYESRFLRLKERFRPETRQQPGTAPAS